MAGEARTNSFMLGTATVMVGPQEDLFDLNTQDHSLGLVKNFTMTSEPAYTELTQGVKNSIVYSVMTSNPVRATMEVFEFTAKNIAYSLGLSGNSLAAQTVVSTVAASLEAADEEVTVGTGDGSKFAKDDWIMLQDGDDDKVLIRKVTGVQTDKLSISPKIGWAMSDKTKVRLMNAVQVGSKEEQPYLSAKIVGTLANREEVAILIPKIRIIRGFTMAFTTDDYGNLPVEFQVYDLVDSDPNYAEFGGHQAKVFTAA